MLQLYWIKTDHLRLRPRYYYSTVTLMVIEALRKKLKRGIEQCLTSFLFILTNIKIQNINYNFFSN